MPQSEHELRLRERLGRLKNLSLLGGAKLSGELERLQRQIDKIGERRDRRGDLAQGRARAPRPSGRTRSTTSSGCSDDWFELHGDRALADDGAMIAGLGKLRRPHDRPRRAAEGPGHP